MVQAVLFTGAMRTIGLVLVIGSAASSGCAAQIDPGTPSREGSSGASSGANPSSGSSGSAPSSGRDAESARDSAPDAAPPDCAGLSVPAVEIICRGIPNYGFGPSYVLENGACVLEIPVCPPFACTQGDACRPGSRCAASAANGCASACTCDATRSFQCAVECSDAATPVGCTQGAACGDFLFTGCGSASAGGCSTSCGCSPMTSLLDCTTSCPSVDGGSELSDGGADADAG